MGPSRVLTSRYVFQAHNKGITALIMLPEGTLLSGGEKDRKIIAWDSLQNYNKITETKVPYSIDVCVCVCVFDGIFVFDSCQRCTAA